MSHLSQSPCSCMTLSSAPRASLQARVWAVLLPLREMLRTSIAWARRCFTAVHKSTATCKPQCIALRTARCFVGHQVLDRGLYCDGGQLTEVSLVRVPKHSEVCVIDVGRLLNVSPLNKRLAHRLRAGCPEEALGEVVCCQWHRLVNILQDLPFWYAEHWETQIVPTPCYLPLYRSEHTDLKR